MRRIARIAAACALVACLSAAGIAFASIPGSDGSVHACYTTAGPYEGVARIIDADVESCDGSEAAIAWPAGGPEFAVVEKPGSSPTVTSSSAGVEVEFFNCSGAGSGEQCSVQLDFGHSLADCAVTGSPDAPSASVPFSVRVDGSGFAVFVVQAFDGAGHFSPVRLVAVCA